MRRPRFPAAFAGHAKACEGHAATRLGRLRQELGLQYLPQHLAPLPHSLKILDAGAGTGGCAIGFARQGHRVCPLDCSAQTLAITRRKAGQVDLCLLEETDFCRAPTECASWLTACPPRNWPL